MVQAKKFIYAKRFEGMPKVSDFRLEEETLPALNDGEALAEAIYLSVDPYMRTHSQRIPVGVTMIGGQVANVIESKNDNYPVGAIVYGAFGWRTHTIFDDNFAKADPTRLYIYPSFGSLSLTLGLGPFGRVGNSAYFGFLDNCKPQQGEVVVVSGAAVAVGSLVGQIAKIKDCKVIGIAGSDDKCKWLMDEVGFDHAINYKTEDIAEHLGKYAPEGVDCYFDNVGGEISSTVIYQMRDFGRICVCGSISAYNLPITEWPQLPHIQPIINHKQLEMRGFQVSSFWYKWFEGFNKMKEWID